MNATRHVPVMVAEVLEYLHPVPGAIIIDCTFGGGGHAAAIVDRILPGGRLLGIDRDPAAIARCRERLAGQPVTCRQGSFHDLEALLDREGIAAVDGFLFDLGLSSDQLEDAARGFSFRREGPLDMRFDPETPVTAADLVRRLREAELARIFREGGEERWANRIARAITTSRQRSQITTTAQLQQIIAASLPAAARRAKTDPATRAFQALRIAVNDEAAALEAGLAAAIARTRTGGRIVVLSYHSNEDGVTKGTFRRLASKCQCPPLLPTCICAGRAQLKLLTRKPLSPSPEERAGNPRSRSAKLRAAEKL